MLHMTTSRLDTLKAIVDQNPGDSRTRYMLAMELGNAGDYEGALREHKTILTSDRDYVAAYFQAGQMLERLDKAEEAKGQYRAGMEACGRTGDAHTKAELEAALEALG